MLFHYGDIPFTRIWTKSVFFILMVWISRNIGVNTAGVAGGFISACGFILGLLLAVLFGWSITLLSCFAYTVPKLFMDSFRMAVAAPIPTLVVLVAVLCPSLLLEFWPEAELYVLPLAIYFGGGLSATLIAWCSREEIRRIELRVGYDRMREEEDE